MTVRSASPIRIQIAGRTYTADCGQENVTDDVGDTRETAHRLTVPQAGTTQYEFWYSPEYSITPGDVDFFVLSVTQRVWFGVGSAGPTDVEGVLYDNNGVVLDLQNNNRDDGRNFLLFTLALAGNVLRQSYWSDY